MSRPGVFVLAAQVADEALEAVHELRPKVMNVQQSGSWQRPPQEHTGEA